MILEIIFSDALVSMKVAPANLYEISVSLVFLTYMCEWLVVFDSFSPLNSSPPGPSVHGIFPDKNTGVGCHFFLQRIFPTQGSNPCLLHWQANSSPLSCLGDCPNLNESSKCSGDLWGLIYGYTSCNYLMRIHSSSKLEKLLSLEALFFSCRCRRGRKITYPVHSVNAPVIDDAFFQFGYTGHILDFSTCFKINLLENNAM